jgi:demethylmenaquinone methyltransferase/2-methoxy-6-polyprenyl-1,4-benzoquinol methylase
MFDAAASHYDWITSVMSFGSGTWYRNQALLRAGCAPGHRVLDVGAGTGIVSALAQKIVGPGGQVVALDPSHGMLEQARKSGVIHTVQGLGERLPFEDAQFDLVTMGYALRHVADLGETFAEYFRVLKPGGKVLLLEISKPKSSVATAIFKFYMKGIVPNVARVARRSLDAKVLMQYYWDTIERCVPPEQILEALRKARFSDTDRHVEIAICSDYTGIKR